MISIPWKQVFSRTPLSFQVQHMCNLVVFMLVGKLNANMGVMWAEIAATVAAAIGTEWLGRRFVGSKSAHFPVPSVIAALAICMILRSPKPWVLPLAASVGIASKYLLRAGGAHFQNPSNFGVLYAVLLLPDQAFLQTAEWDLNPVGYGVVALAGVLLVSRAGLVLETAVGLGALLLARYAVETRNPTTLVYGLFHVTLLLYIFFLQNDPRVLPPSRKGRIAFLVLAAALHVGLVVVFGRKDSNLPLSLALASLTIPFWRWVASQEARPAWTPRAEVALYALPPVLLLSLAASPLNRRANLVASIQRAGGLARLSTAPAVPERPQTQAEVDAAAQPGIEVPKPEGAWANDWRSGEVLRTPLPAPAPRGQARFVRKDILPALPPGPPDSYNTWAYAGLAAGDIDHDGHLDLLACGEGRPLGAWLWRNGRFEDFTARLFPDRPVDVEQAALADMDGDGWLDAIMAVSQYGQNPRPGGIWRFVPERGHFERLPRPVIGAGRRSSGGFGVHDINGDGILDIYASFGLDWHYRQADFYEVPFPHELWVSDGPLQWHDGWKELLPEKVTRTSYAGMTSHFGDVDGDGKLDLLVGNDFLDPSLFLTQGKDGRFSLVPPGYVEANTTHSMTYLPQDFDGDGREELFEVGLAPPFLVAVRSDISVDSQTPTPRVRDQEMKAFILGSSRGQFDCASYKDGLVRWMCEMKLRSAAALQRTDLALCQALPNGMVQAVCERNIRTMQLNRFGAPQNLRYDVELFPKQVRENVMLKYEGPSTGYKLVRQEVPVEFTGWSWAAYPEDLDGDGKVDLAISSSYAMESFHPNRMLRNVSTPGNPRLHDVTQEAGLAFEDQSRGVVAADFDEDGDADLVFNNLAGEPSYWENQSGGDRLEVELRGREGNRYGLGAVLELRTDRGVQLRRMTLGGVWDSGQPPRIRFSLPQGETLRKLTVRWPGGKEREVLDVRPNERLVLFE